MRQQRGKKFSINRQPNPKSADSPIHVCLLGDTQAMNYQRCSNANPGGCLLFRHPPARSQQL